MSQLKVVAALVAYYMEPIKKVVAALVAYYMEPIK